MTTATNIDKTHGAANRLSACVLADDVQRVQVLARTVWHDLTLAPYLEAGPTGRSEKTELKALSEMLRHIDTDLAQIRTELVGDINAFLTMPVGMSGLRNFIRARTKHIRAVDHQMQHLGRVHEQLKGLAESLAPELGVNWSSIDTADRHTAEHVLEVVCHAGLFALLRLASPAAVDENDRVKPLVAARFSFRQDMRVEWRVELHAGVAKSLDLALQIPAWLHAMPRYIPLALHEVAHAFVGVRLEVDLAFRAEWQRYQSALSEWYLAAQGIPPGQSSLSEKSVADAYGDSLLREIASDLIAGRVFGASYFLALAFHSLGHSWIPTASDAGSVSSLPTGQIPAFLPAGKALAPPFRPHAPISIRLRVIEALLLTNCAREAGDASWALVDSVLAHRKLRADDTHEAITFLHDGSTELCLAFGATLLETMASRHCPDLDAPGEKYVAAVASIWSEFAQNVAKPSDAESLIEAMEEVREGRIMAEVTLGTNRDLPPWMLCLSHFRKAEDTGTDDAKNAASTSEVLIPAQSWDVLGHVDELALVPKYHSRARPAEAARRRGHVQYSRHLALRPIVAELLPTVQRPAFAVSQVDLSARTPELSKSFIASVEAACQDKPVRIAFAFRCGAWSDLVVGWTKLPGVDAVDALREVCSVLDIVSAECLRSITHVLVPPSGEAAGSLHDGPLPTAARLVSHTQVRCSRTAGPMEAIERLVARIKSELGDTALLDAMSHFGASDLEIRCRLSCERDLARLTRVLMDAVESGLILNSLTDVGVPIL